MATSQLIGLLLRHWLVTGMFAVLGVVGAVCLALYVVPPTYSATVQLYVSGTGTGDTRLQNGEYARTHVASYAEMVDSTDLLEAVRDELNLPPSEDGTYRDLATSITASNPLDTLIIDVTVEASSPQRAQAVAAAIGQVYNSVVARIESPSSARQSPVRISVVSPPALPINRDSPSRKMYAAAGLIAGLAVGAGVAWLLELRKTRRNRRSGISQASNGSWDWWPGENPPSSTAKGKGSDPGSSQSSEHEAAMRMPTDV